MFKDTGGNDAASILLNLTDYRVIDATQEPAGRQVLIEPKATEAACPTCGVITTRIHSRPVHRVKDLPTGGNDIQVLVRKRRMTCQETACELRSFVQTTEQLPFRVCVPSFMATMMARLNIEGEFAADIDWMFIGRLGIDEHHFRKVR